MGTLCGGCSGSAEIRGLEERMVGRWVGDPIDPPARQWWTHASFDLAFSEDGVFSALAETYEKGKTYPVRFEGEYEVIGGDTVKVEQRELGGEWKVGPARDGAKDRVTFSRGDIVLELRKKHGT